MNQPRLGISRCLLGDLVRYDGGHKRNTRVLELFEPYVEWVPVCPEVEVGMGTPREPIQLVADPSSAGRTRLVAAQSGRDWTTAMHDWAHGRVAELAGLELSGFILKADSPSCGPTGVRVVAETSVSFNGRGVFADVLSETFPDLPVEDEQRLADPARAQEFLKRVLAYRSH